MKRLRRNLTPGRTITLGFLALILLGAFLLSLPAARTASMTASPLDSLFTATSAACVTGLVVTETGGSWTVFGKTVILLLIQIGGLGVAAIGVADVHGDTIALALLQSHMGLGIELDVPAVAGRRHLLQRPAFRHVLIDDLFRLIQMSPSYRTFVPLFGSSHWI